MIPPLETGRGVPNERANGRARHCAPAVWHLRSSHRFSGGDPGAGANRDERRIRCRAAAGSGHLRPRRCRRTGQQPELEGFVNDFESIRISKTQFREVVRELVVDEFGGTSGIVSMEDIIEEIFGEIDDEYDNEALTEQLIGDQEYLLSARLEIDYLNDKYGWDLPYGDFETLSGFILSLTENLPNKGETVIYGAFTFTIVTKQAHRIETVRLKISGSDIF